jgi:hypothetical protein
MFWQQLLWSTRAADGRPERLWMESAIKWQHQV